MITDKQQPCAEAVEAARKIAEICGMGAFDTALFDKLALEVQSAIDARLTEVMKENARGIAAMRALESLTPSGSEYVNDVKRCLTYIRDRQHNQHRFILKKVTQCKELEARLEEERKETEQWLKTTVYVVGSQSYCSGQDASFYHGSNNVLCALRDHIEALLARGRKAQ